MFVSAGDIEAFTGLKRPSAQARFLDRLGIKYVEVQMVRSHCVPRNSIGTRLRNSLDLSQRERRWI
jgi:hypothetical protein